MRSDPTVAVIIPTCNRPALLIRALESVLLQSQQPDEILVVVDGPSPETLVVLKSFCCPALRVLSLETRSGVCVARNHGISHATSRWIAFLDDDDEWLPHKLFRQIRVAENTAWRNPIVCSQILVRTSTRDSVFPRRGPAQDETIPEYLFCRKTILPWEVLLQSSNLLTSRALLEQVPFTPGLKKWDDTDWLVRAAQIDGTGLDFIPEPLSVWYVEDGPRATLSSTFDWRYLFAWTKANRQLMPSLAYSGALLRDVAREAMRERSSEAFWPLLREAIRHGRPDAVQLMSFFVAFAFTWFVPNNFIARARRLATHFVPGRIKCP
jgi:glycosyltransferase involved in cell wall biosynthesis